jgi:hypothetical protein
MADVVGQHWSPGYRSEYRRSSEFHLKIHRQARVSTRASDQLATSLAEMGCDRQSSDAHIQA